MLRIVVWVVLGAFGLLLASAVPHQVIAQQIQEHPALPGIGEKGFLQAGLIDLTEQSTAALGLRQRRAVLVLFVFLGSNAERAGLRAGDVITEFEGAIVPSADDLDHAMRRRGAGATIEFGVWRRGQVSTIRAILARYADFGHEVDVAEVEAAIHTFNHETFPLEWAALQRTLAHIYSVRALGGLSDDDEKAIAAYERALTVYTHEALLREWANTHGALGGYYRDRIRGDRADNLEKAIAALELALTVLTREASPEWWAINQHSLGRTYTSRIRGDRADNLEKAIAAHEQALTFFTREVQPVTWAIVHTHLGKAYQIRLRADRAENVEKAIASLQLALTAITRESAPGDWANVHSHLGSAYMSRRLGDAVDNQEKAIAAYDQALTVFTLEIPWAWAEAQLNLGDAYLDRTRGDKASNLAKAIGAFEAAWATFTRMAWPLHHLRTGRRLGAAWLQAGDVHKASEAYASAREAFLQLFGQGLNEAEARHLIEEAGPLFAEMAFAATERGEFKTALEVANEGRARQLRVALRRQAIELPAAARPRYDALIAELRGWERIAETAEGNNAVTALEKVATLRQQLGELIGPHLPKELGLTREGIPEGGAVVVPVVTKLGGKLLIVTEGGGEPEIGVVDLPQLTSARLDRVMRGDGGWLEAYLVQEKNEKRWLHAIDRLGPELWTLLGEGMDRGLKARGIKPGARVAVLPTAALGLLPLGLAQDPTSKQRLAETWEMVLAPSFEALAKAATQVVQPTAPSLAAAINPTGDLPFTEIEGALVAARFAARQSIKLDTNVATSDVVVAALKGKSYWHFASHGTFDWSDARQSGLLMREGERLTVGQLIEAQGSLGRPRLVVLSACETGLYDIDRNPDEFVGLPATFMQAGAAGVVGSLWLVDDLATALLMAKFYDLHLGGPGGGVAPPASLKQAQVWLRSSTRTELMAYARGAARQAKIDRTKLSELNSVLTRGQRSASSRFAGLWKALTGEQVEPAPLAKQRKRKPAARAQRPFEHPYFWAGFVYTGL
jgi:CHAT domain-containing protein/tetratricopeptide (TPR) repeat protein